MPTSPVSYKGLTDEEVREARTRHGLNKTELRKENGFLIAAKGLVKEPMFILLLVASAIYFISGKTGDGLFMLAAIILVSAISFFQESRSRNALDALRKFTEPYAKVIRNGKEISLASEEIVVGDCMKVEEGSAIPADGIIIEAHDFAVNESILTGESFPVLKNESDNNQVFQGTTVTAGMAICRVEAIGSNTRLTKIGASIQQITDEKTPLQLQIENFVKKLALAGFIIFLAVWIINFFTSRNLLDSLLKSLTLAMSILPEEIPVAFTTFMALGAWRLMKMGIIVKQTKTVETLGSANVICVDKTGTITENKMSLAGLYVHNSRKSITLAEVSDESDRELIRMAMWSSEPVPFDPMEMALHEAYTQYIQSDERGHYTLIHEYPLEGRPPMMTHVFESKEGTRIIASKGAPEAIMRVSQLTKEERAEVEQATTHFASMGYRVLAVGEARHHASEFHEEQHAYQFRLVGLVAFYDPPKKNMKEVLTSFYKAGMQVKIITGDNAATTITIAKQIGFKGTERSITGEELLALNNNELMECVKTTHIFTRMFPEAKLRIINTLKAAGQIVAMTGDGVNDGPALKAAHIGIAMGKKGSEIAKRASSLILMDDDLAHMVDAIAMGRRIYTNLKKAIQYIISIHIPIILVVLLPLALGWVYPVLFSPVHIIFLEMIMGPTCSIIYENEPLEKNVMEQSPRPFTTTFFNLKELTTSIIQGLVITAGALGVYQYAVYANQSEATTRTMIFLVLISANVFLTLVNRSFYYSVLTTLKYKNNLLPLIIGITLVLTGLLLYVTPLIQFFEFTILPLHYFLISIAAGFISVSWFEAVKVYQRRWNKNLK